MTSPSQKEESKNKSLIKNYYLWKQGEIHFIVFLLFLIIVTKLFFFDEFLSFFNCCNHFNTLRQLIVPSVFGAIGGYSFVIMSSLNSTYNRNVPHVKKKFSFIGAVAGIAAVNLLNPSGSVSQVMILSLIAGLSGISYLKRNALVGSEHEESLLENLKADRRSLQNKEVDTSSSSTPLKKDTSSPDIKMDRILKEIKEKQKELKNKVNKNEE